jgi:hypothetical protein
MSRGEHIYVDGWCAGIPFQHHGIDMGDGTVVHLAPEAGARVTLRASQCVVFRWTNLQPVKRFELFGMRTDCLPIRWFRAHWRWWARPVIAYWEATVSILLVHVRLVRRSAGRLI